MLTQCKFTLNNLLVGVITMGYQWAILAVFIMFALLEAKNGKLFKKALSPVKKTTKRKPNVKRTTRKKSK